jgi:hypothetical protein
MSARLLSLLSLTIGVVSAGYDYDEGAKWWWSNDDNQEHCSLAHKLYSTRLYPVRLYPVRPILDDWTTSDILRKPLPIDDETFRSVNILSNTTRRVLEAPDGVVSLEGFYPNGSFTFTHTPRGGYSFYAPGPEDIDLTAAKEATFAYTVLFPEGYEWVKGGKLPGFCTYMYSSFTSFPIPDRMYD